MHLALVLVALSAAAPIKLASPGLSYVGLEAPIGDAILDRFVSELARAGNFKITTKNDVAQVLGIERQKQLLGCSEGQSNCLAELAGALGVDGIISGSLAKIGAGFTVTLRVVRATDGSELATASTRVKNEEELQDWLDAQAAPLAETINSRLTPPPPPGTMVARFSSGGSRIIPWLPGIAGAALLLGGGLTFGFGKGDAILLSQMVPPPDIDAIAGRGELRQQVGVGLMIAGGAAIAASVVWLIVGSGSVPAVSVAPVREGLVVGIGGEFP